MVGTGRVAPRRVGVMNTTRIGIPRGLPTPALPSFPPPLVPPRARALLWGARPWPRGSGGGRTRRRMKWHGKSPPIAMRIRPRGEGEERHV